MSAMSKTRKPTGKPPLALIGLVVLLIFSIAILSGCQGAPKFPAKYVWEVDTIDRVCARYEITDPVKLRFKPAGEYPLNQCHGTFGFSAEDIPKVFDWAEKMHKYAEERCK